MGAPLMFWRLLDRPPIGPHGGGLIPGVAVVAAILFVYLGYLLVTEIP